MSAASEAPVVVIDYGMGNIHSIVKAVRLYVPNVVFTDDPAQIARARALVLPGDGAFPAAMQNLAGDLENALRDFVAAGRPLLGVCIGFQILFEDSDEVVGPDEAPALTPGLGLIPGHIRRFRFDDASVRVPHMGWNRLHYAGESAPGDYVYFIHSYRAEGVPEDLVIAKCEYAGDVFPAFVRNKAGNILATQFHPEKSDRVGLKIIEDWAAGLKKK